MSNHIHLGLIAGTAPLRRWLRPMHTNFAMWINARRKRIGAVFVRGPNVIDVLPDGGARLINYIHRNPVRAGVASDPSASDWTSHRAYVGLSHRPSWLDVDCGLELAQLSTSEYGTWVDSNQVTREELDAYQTIRIREPGRPLVTTETSAATIGPRQGCVPARRYRERLHADRGDLRGAAGEARSGANRAAAAGKRRNPPEQEAGFFVAAEGTEAFQPLSRASRRIVGR